MVRSRPRSVAARAKQREMMNQVREANPQAFEKPARDLSGVRDLGWRFSFLRVFFWLYAVGAVLGAVSSYRVIRFLEDAFQGRFATEVEMMERANAIDTAETIRTAVTVLIFITCVFAYGMFTVRAAKNLEEAGSKELSMSPHSLVWWHFVPFANLIMPAQGIAEVTRGTKEVTGERTIAPASLGLWWGTWILGMILNSIANGMSQASNIESGFGGDFRLYQKALWVGIVASLAFCAAAILFVQVARRIREGQARITGHSLIETFD